MKKYQLMLLSGTSHFLWCGVMLGLLWTMVSYWGKTSWKFIWGAMFLPPLVALIFCHVGWLSYSFALWKWDYEFSFFIHEVVRPVVFFIWGGWSLFIVPSVFFFICLPEVFSDQY